MAESSRREFKLYSALRSANFANCWTIALDFGLRTISCAYRPPSEQYPVGSIATIGRISFSEDCYDVPTEATWLRRGQGSFCYGSELRKKLCDGEVLEEDVVRFPMLLLYEELEPPFDAIVKQEQAKLERLGRSSVDPLIEELFRHIYEHCKQFMTIREDKTIPTYGKYPDVLICVPHNFSNAQAKRILNLAISAGIPRRTIVSKAECAASYHFQEAVRGGGGDDFMMPKLPMELNSSDVILVGHAGGGTFDGGAFKLESDAQDGSTTHLVPIQDRMFGRLCGSECANQLFLEWLKNEWQGRVTYIANGGHSEVGGLSQLLTELDIPMHLALARAYAGFERNKGDWYPDDPHWLGVVLIIGRNGTDMIRIDLSQTLMKQFFRPVTDGIMETLAQYCGPDIKCVILSGGLFQTPYLYENAKRHFGQIFRVTDDWHTCKLVPYGAILRFQNIDLELSPESLVSFGVVSAYDPFDIEHHFEAWDLVEEDPWGRPFMGFVVPDRIGKWFTLAESFRAGEEIFWQCYEPTWDDLRLKAKVCWTANRNLHDHEPLKDRNGNIREGINLLTEDFEVEIDPEELGYSMKWSEKGRNLYYPVQAAIALSSVDGMLTFQWYIAQAGMGPWDDEGKIIRPQSQAFRSAILLQKKELFIPDLRWTVRNRLRP